MRTTHVSMILGFSASLVLAGQLLACGGDDAPAGQTSSSSGGEPPTSSSSGTLPDAGPPSGPTVTISDSKAKVYLGQKAVLDAAVAPGSTAWTVVYAPSQSAITTASLEAAGSATPAFTPDVLGSYTLQGTGGASTVLVFIEAIDAPIFWRSLVLTATQTDAETIVEGSGGTKVGGVHTLDARSVGCSSEGIVSAASANIVLQTMSLAAVGSDVWEGPAGTPARFAFPDFQGEDPAHGVATLNVTTSNGACADAKTLVTVSNADAGADASSDIPRLVAGVRFSPGGGRLAYSHDRPTGGPLISTIGFDGAAPRDLGPQLVDADGGTVDGSFSAQAAMPTPRWQDETHVGWIASPAPAQDGSPTLALGNWDLYVAEDAAGAAPALFMHCERSSVTSFEFLPDGSIVAAARHDAIDADGGASTPGDVLVYRPNATTKACEVVRSLTHHTDSATATRGLSLSPDKARVAFVEGAASGTLSSESLDVWWAAVDGSSPAELVPGTAPLAAAPLAGTRWAAGGTVLTWLGPSTAAGPGGPLAGNIVALPLGGTLRTLATTSLAMDPTGTVSHIEVVAGAGQGCNVGGDGVPFGTLALGGIVGAIGLVLRRVRRP